jgi:N,N-dimethylformamidase
MKMATESKEIIGYTDCISVEPGARVPFKVSCESRSYRADIVRLIHGDPHPDGPGRKEELIESSVSGTYQGRVQEIRTGSYVAIQTPSADLDVTSLTLQALIYPTLPSRGWQGLLTRWDAAKEIGYGLFIGPEGDLVTLVGDGSATLTVRSGVELYPHR